MTNRPSHLPVVCVLALCALMLAGSLASCGESAKERAQRETIDSLLNANELGRMDYDDLQQYLTVIADGLDSISLEEGELLVNARGEGSQLNRQRMKQDLEHVRALLSRHRERIAQLEQQLAGSQGDARRLRTIITALREQVEAKDRELEQLRADLEDSRRSVNDLTRRVEQMAETQDEMAQAISEQQRTIDEQTQRLNTAYMKVASKSVLKEMGLLSGGLFKKKRVDYSQVDLSQFTKLDISTTTQIPLPRKAKVLSPQPQGSYVIEGGALRILDSDAFWSVSNLLIIQAE